MRKKDPNRYETRVKSQDSEKNLIVVHVGGGLRPGDKIHSLDYPGKVWTIERRVEGFGYNAGFIVDKSPGDDRLFSVEIERVTSAWKEEEF